MDLDLNNKIEVTGEIRGIGETVTKDRTEVIGETKAKIVIGVIEEETSIITTKEIEATMIKNLKANKTTGKKKMFPCK